MSFNINFCNNKLNSCFIKNKTKEFSMNKRCFFLPLLLLFGMFLTSCKSKNDNNNPITPNTNAVGSLYIVSSPASAQIWLDTINTGKITPDSITNISIGNHIVILKLAGFLDSTIALIIQEGTQTPLNITLTSDQSVTAYGPIQIWESAETTGLFSGIILKTGSPSLIAGGGGDSVDLYYSSNGLVISTPSSSINNRNTFFFVGLSNNLNDGVESPTKIDSWVTQVNNTETNYFFLFDADSCYSKMIITADSAGSISGSPAWIKVKWLHNNKPNDRRF